MFNRIGMTLIEIMVVVALMSIILGGGIAIFNRAGKVNETTAMVYDIKSILTRARNTSLSQGQRVEVAFDLVHNQVLSYMRRPIGYLHFEDRDIKNSGSDMYNIREFSIAGPGSIVKAQAVDNAMILPYEGRDGNCAMLNMYSQSSTRPGYIKIPYQRIYDCQRGISLACDFKIDSYSEGAMVLFSKGRSLYLAIAEDGTFVAGGTFQGQLVHKGKFVLGIPDNVQSDIEIYTRERLTLHKWHHVELTFSNLGLRIALDGVILESFLENELAEQEAPAQEMQTEAAIALDSFYLPVFESELTIGAFPGGSEAFYGLVDNVQISEIQSGESIELRPEMLMFGDMGESNENIENFNPGGNSETYSFGKIWVHFSPDGFLDPAYHRTSVLIFLRNTKNPQTKRIRITTAGIVD